MDQMKCMLVKAAKPLQRNRCSCTDVLLVSLTQSCTAESSGLKACRRETHLNSLLGKTASSAAAVSAGSDPAA